MKIIGQTKGGYILEASGDELANICGYSYSNELKGSNTPCIGLTIQVWPLYEALQFSRKRKAEIAHLAESLRKIAKRVDTINEVLANPIIEEKKPG